MKMKLKARKFSLSTSLRQMLTELEQEGYSEIDRILIYSDSVIVRFRCGSSEKDSPVTNFKPHTATIKINKGNDTLKRIKDYTAQEIIDLVD